MTLRWVWLNFLVYLLGLVCFYLRGSLCMWVVCVLWWVQKLTSAHPNEGFVPILMCVEICVCEFYVFWDWHKKHTSAHPNEGFVAIGYCRCCCLFGCSLFWQYDVWLQVVHLNNNKVNELLVNFLKKLLFFCWRINHMSTEITVAVVVLFVALFLTIWCMAASDSSEYQHCCSRWWFEYTIQ